MANRLSDAAAAETPQAIDPHEWCARRNAEMSRKDVAWAVVDGVPRLIESAAWAEEYHAKLEKRLEAERQKHLHRQKYPITARKEKDHD